MPKTTKVEDKPKNDKSKKGVKVQKQTEESDEENHVEETKKDKKSKHVETSTESKTKESKSDKSKTDKSSKSETKDTKDTKDTKSKNENGERSWPNDETERSGQFFNVKSVKQWMKSFYNDYTVAVVTKDDEGNKVVKKGKVKFVSGAHWCLTATDQIICSTLINAASKRSVKGVDGLYTITELNVRDSIESDPELKFVFNKHLPFFDRKNRYIQSLTLSAKDVSVFIEKYCVNGNSTTRVDAQALNLVMFLMHENRKCLAESAYQMCQYAGKSSVNDRAFLCSIRTMYPEGDLQKALFAKAEDASYKARGTEVSKEMSDKSEDTDKKQKKGTTDSKDNKKTKSSKTGKKKQVKEESDEESDAGSDTDSDAESNNGSDSESDDDNESD